MIRGHRRSAAAALFTATLLLAGCSDSGSDAAACRGVERLVEPSSVHVLPGVPVNYDASPPTSGPHQIPAPSAGVYTEALAEPLQVGALEAGLVIVQYGPATSAADVGEIEALSDGTTVIVMPGARTFDEGAAVAFTAWGNRQLCDSVDADAAADFIDRFGGLVFTNHG